MLFNKNVINIDDSIILRLLLTNKVGVRTAFLLLQAVKENQENYKFADIFTCPKNLGVPVTRQQIACLCELPQNFDEYMKKHKLWLMQDNHHFIHIWHADYPPSLLDLHDPPIALYIKAKKENLAKLKQINISMVGSRQATPNGLQTAFNFASELSNHGFCIVSGLADGIDASCHKGALTGLASTIAVIGTGIDIIYPQKNTKLSTEIANSGCVISEFALGVQPKAANFPRRNRIIAALCRGIIVVEASLKSGSLITARLANEIGRDIFAIPSSIYSPASKGCHALIKQGATLLESVQDILDEWQGAQLTKPNSKIKIERENTNIIINNEEQFSIFSLTNKSDNIDDSHNHTIIENKILNLPQEHSQILQAMGYDAVDIDTLCERLQIDNNELQASLFILELEQYIIRLAGGRYQRLA